MALLAATLFLSALSPLGCVRLVPARGSDGGSLPADMGTAEALPRDGAPDRTGLDAPEVDGRTDGAKVADLPTAKPDQPKPKLDLKTAKPDLVKAADLVAKPDLPKFKLDVKVADLAKPSPDLSVAAPCAQGVVALGTATGNGLVFCQGVGVTQCNASTLCNTVGGYRLCSATEYRSAFVATSPLVSDAWIAGCIRSGGLPYAPADTICSCAPSPIQARALCWGCTAGTLISSTVGNVGLVSSAICHRVGRDEPDTAAYWDVKDASTTTQRAACCK